MNIFCLSPADVPVMIETVTPGRIFARNHVFDINYRFEFSPNVLQSAACRHWP
jgi:hypothetical protein